MMITSRITSESGSTGIFVIGKVSFSSSLSLMFAHVGIELL